MAKRQRGKGEGGLRYDKIRGRWEGTVELPRGADGARRRKRVFAPTKHVANEKKRELERRLGMLGDIQSTMTYAQWSDYWLDNIVQRRVRESTLRHYAGIVRNDLKPALGHVPLDKMTVAHVRAAITKLDDRPAAAAKAYTILRMSLKAAMREGHVDRNPADRMDKPRAKSGDLETLTVDEMKQIIKHLSDTEHPLSALWLTYMLTGARRGELLGLRWEYVDDLALDLSWQLVEVPAASTIPKHQESQHVRGTLWLTRPKSEAGRRLVPIVAPLRIVLDAHRKMTSGEGLVFTTRDGEALRPEYVSKEWKRVVAAAGITKRIRLHDIRRATVTLLLDAGVHQTVVQQIVGHSDVMMTLHYRNRADMEQLSRVMAGAVGALGLDAPAWKTA